VAGGRDRVPGAVAVAAAQLQLGACAAPPTGRPRDRKAAVDAADRADRARAFADPVAQLAQVGERERGRGWGDGEAAAQHARLAELGGAAGRARLERGAGGANRRREAMAG